MLLILPYNSFLLGSIDCTLTFSHPTWYWENLLKICVFIFAFIMPVLIITVCYGLMIDQEVAPEVVRQDQLAIGGKN